METLRRMYTGRIARMQYFILSLIAILPVIAASLLFMPADPKATFTVAQQLLGLTMFVYGAFATWHLEVRRLHDMGLNGWWLVAILVFSFTTFGPILMFVFGAILLFMPGEKDANKYGPPAPSDRGLTAAFFNQ